MKKNLLSVLALFLIISFGCKKDDSSPTNTTPTTGVIATVQYEGKTYHTVQIGSQCWLKENLDVGTQIQGTSSPINNGTIEKYCYDNDPANCTTYGGLYTWNEAMQYVTTPGARGICPVGWHIPTKAEFEALKAAVTNDGNALKANGQGTRRGAGTNTSGFSALLGGGRSSIGYFSDLRMYTEFWSSAEYDTTYVAFMYLYYDDSYIQFDNCNKEFVFSVRCAKD